MNAAHDPRQGERRAGLLLLTGLAVEALSLVGLNTPAGFLTFAILGGSLIGAGILVFLWTVYRRPSSDLEHPGLADGSEGPIQE